MQRFGNQTISAFMPFFLTYGFLAIIPWAVGLWSIWTDVLIFGLFAISYNLLLGQTGMISFGHAAYLGLGAYGTAMFLVGPESAIRYSGSWAAWLSVPMGVLLATAVGTVTAVLTTRRRGTYFALITLAIAQALFYAFSTNFYGIPEAYFGASYLSPTGGSDGLTAVYPPAIFGIKWNTTINWYYFVLIVVALTVLLIRQIYRSPFGQVLKGIRDDEVRARLLGYDINRYRQIAFIFSAMFSGFAGSLLALNIGYAGPEVLFWTRSGEVIIMVLLGGMLQFWGPLIGAMTYIIVKDLVSQYTLHWMLIAGVLVCAETLLGKGQGLVDLGEWIWNRVRRQS